MIEINLLAEQQEVAVPVTTEPSPMTGLLIGVGVLAVSILLVVFFYFRTENYISDLQEQVVSARQEVQRLQEDLRKVEELEARKRAADNRFKAIETLAKNRTLPVHILMEFSRAITELAWLEGLEVAGMNFRATGLARQERAVVDLVENLNRSPYFENVTLTDWRLIQGDVGRFSISGNIVNPIAAATETEEGQ